MSTYVLLVSFTDKGRRNFKQEYTESRDEFKRAVEKAGGKLTGYVTAGPYDAVDAVRIMSLRAFPED